jgi:group I intron endonuclease
MDCVRFIDYNGCMKICGIYKITHRESGRAYVGLSVDIYARWRQHKSFARHGRKSAIYSALLKYGPDAFSFEVLEKCDRSLLEDREKHWIAELKTAVNGYNLTLGGESNKEVSEETKKKLSLAHLGKRQSEETKEKRAAKLRGVKRTPEQNAAKSALMKGVGKGRKLPLEVIEKIGKPFLGKKHSEESKAKMSEAKKGKAFTDEHKKNLSESHLGYRFSEKRKLKHSEALKAYWAKRKAQIENDGRINT